MKSLARLGLALSLMTGCATGMERVHEPQALVAPADQAVMVIVQPQTSYLSAVMLDERGSCLGYTHGGDWFTMKLRPGQHIFHLKEAEAVLSAKLDVGAGKTYFIEPMQKGQHDLAFHSINPSAKDWRDLDDLLKNGTQFRVDRKTCNSTLGEMTWMPGQDLKALIKEGGQRAKDAPPMITPEDGVVWRGSTAKSTR